MKYAHPIADRIRGSAFRLAGAVLFLFSLAMFVLVAEPARAQEPSCKGRNLVEELQRTAPAVLRLAREQAAAIPNGEGLLWQIEGADGASSFLFGTMHVTDP